MDAKMSPKIRIVADKHAISVWISWVLLVALSVMIGSMVLQWSKGQATKTVEDITEKGEILTLCQETGVAINSYCQNTQTLNINVTNNNNRKVDSLLVRGFDIYGNPDGGSRNISLEPEKTKAVVIVKQGVLKRAEVMPVIISGKKSVVCQSRKVALEDIGFC
ncbi:hypothetical protein HYV85_00535 [Candidatus Woesearchaeota archaeon]|nr:hypothetical protein [Candidatus Woesearchaeota archaeon]